MRLRKGFKRVQNIFNLSALIWRRIYMVTCQLYPVTRKPEWPFCRSHAGTWNSESSGKVRSVQIGPDFNEYPGLPESLGAPIPSSSNDVEFFAIFSLKRRSTTPGLVVQDQFPCTHNAIQSMSPFCNRSQTFPPVKLEGTQINNSLPRSPIATPTPTAIAHSLTQNQYPDLIPSLYLTATWACELVNW